MERARLVPSRLRSRGTHRRPRSSSGSTMAAGATPPASRSLAVRPRRGPRRARCAAEDFARRLVCCPRRTGCSAGSFRGVRTPAQRSRIVDSHRDDLQLGDVRVRRATRREPWTKGHAASHRNPRWRPEGPCGGDGGHTPGVCPAAFARTLSRNLGFAEDWARAVAHLTRTHRLKGSPMVISCMGAARACGEARGSNAPSTALGM